MGNPCPSYTTSTLEKKLIDLDVFQPDLSASDVQKLRDFRKESDYVSLHQHTDFSILDGFASVEMNFQRAAKLGHPATGIADHGTVAGHLKAERAGEKYGVKPVFGIEAYVIPLPLSEMKAQLPKGSRSRVKNSHGCIWAANEQGLKNLWTLATVSTLPENTYYGKPLITFDMLREHREGLFFSDGCLLSDTARWILDEEWDLARQRAITLRDIFGDRFLTELHTFQVIGAESEDDKDLNRQMKLMNQGKVELAKELDIPTILAIDNHYAFKSDYENHEMVWSMNTAYTADQVRSRGQTAAWLMDGEDTLRFLYENGVSLNDARVAKANTLRVAEECNVTIPKQLHHPTIRNSLEADLELFERDVENGFREKTEGMDAKTLSVYRERTDREKAVITENNFHGYFNVVADFVRYAKMSDPEGEHGPIKGKEPWLIGAARGSSGGSLVANLLGINEIDPIPYDLFFERFLNEGRIEAGEFPDVDIDYPRSKLKLAKDYLRWKYGPENVCGISNYSRGKPKSLMKKLAKVFGLSFKEANDLSKYIEQVEDIETPINEETGEPEDVDWVEILQDNPGVLQDAAKQYPDMFRHLQEMLGMVMQQGVHASGMIISRDSLMGNLPMRAVVDKATGDWEWVSQFENSDKFGEDVHDMGYIKFDFLGLRHLDTLSLAQKLVRGEVDPQEFYNWPESRYLDQEVWDQVGTGDTIGLFQEETPAGQRLVKRMRPRSERDMAVVNALVRPGPTDSGMTEHYISRKFGQERVDAFHPLLVDVLSETYGQMVFQEQILSTVQAVAGYSLVDADRVRKAVGRKNLEAISAEREIFVRGCLSNPEFVDQCPEQPAAVANRIWDAIAAAGNYSFNRCLTGDTLVHRSNAAPRDRQFKSNDIPLEEVYRRFNAPAFRGSPDGPIRNKYRSGRLKVVCRDSDGRARSHTLKNIFEQGEQDVFLVTLENGKSVKATANHRFQCADGYKQVSDLTNEDYLWCSDFLYDASKTRSYNFSDVSDVCENCGIAVDGRFETHHVDGDRNNNEPENLMNLCASCHKKLDYELGRVRHGEKGYTTYLSRVVSVEYVGCEMTYDVEIDSEEHNFFANGIVSHNSHAQAYSNLTSWEAWYRHYHRTEYTVALLSTDEKKEEAVRYIRDARSQGVSILPPCVNASGEHFTLVDGGIRFGLASVKGIGPKSVEDIVAKRPFTSVEDYLDRCSAGRNKGVVTKLISIGAFDTLGGRKTAWEALWEWRKANGFRDTYDDRRMPNFDDPEVLTGIEQDLVGTFITADPLAAYSDIIEKSCLAEVAQVDELVPNQMANIGGMIVRVKKITTKTGKPMGFMDVDWNNEIFNVVVFPQEWDQTWTLIEEGFPVVCQTQALKDGGVCLKRLLRLDRMG